MMSRALIRRDLHIEGFLYVAEDAAGASLDSMRSPYIAQLRDRADWVVSAFDGLGTDELNAVTKRLFDAWTTEFHPIQPGPQSELAL